MKLQRVLAAMILGGWAIAAHAGVLFVNKDVATSGDGKSWATGFKTIKEALAAAKASETDKTIYVKKGTYAETNALWDNVKLYGGFAGSEQGTPAAIENRDLRANETIINGAGHDHCLIYYGDAEIPSEVRVDGLTLTGGYANDTEGEIDGVAVSPKIRGGGIAAWGKNHGDSAAAYDLGDDTIATITLANCIIRNNRAKDIGGGIEMDRINGIVENCLIENNTSDGWAGGGNFNSIHDGSFLIRNCVIRNNTASSLWGGGIANFWFRGVIENCRFENNTANGSMNGENDQGHGGGLDFILDSTALVKNCVFVGNDAGTRGGGFSIDGIGELASSATLVNCTFVNNSAATAGGAIHSKDPAELSITNCLFSGNTGGPQIDAGKSSPAVNNLFASATDRYNGNVNASGDVVGDPKLSNAAIGDVNIHPTSPAVNAGTATGAPATDLLGAARTGNPDIGAYESVARWYVNAAVTASGDGMTWGTAFKTIKEGLAEARDDQNVKTIYVAKGTYTEMNWLEDNTSLIGGFAAGEYDMEARNLAANETVINGAGNDHCLIYRDAGEIPSVVTINGLTLTGGDAQSTQTEYEGRPIQMQNRGGGIAAWGAEGSELDATLNIVECRIHNNSCGNIGGGIEADRLNCNVIDCIVENNTAAGWAGAANFNSVNEGVFLLKGSIFRNNTGGSNWGGGVANFWSEGSAEDCIFQDNTAPTAHGGGFDLIFGSHWTVTNCVFDGNSAQGEGGGAYIQEDSSCTFTNCTFVNNTAAQGSAIYAKDPAQIEITNCLFSGNTGGFQIVSEKAASARNNLFASASNKYNGSVTATGDVIGDPMFVGPGDYHLMAASPAIDAGFNTDVPLVDIEGTPRNNGSDIGAYEYFVDGEVAPPNAVRGSWTLY